MHIRKKELFALKQDPASKELVAKFPVWRGNRKSFV